MMLNKEKQNNNEDQNNDEHLFSRSELLIGENGVEKLRNSKVCIFGIGGVGSYAVEALCRAGIGHFKLIDFDEISRTNINRQLHALHSTIGLAKVEVMKERMYDINPKVEVAAYKEFYEGEAAERYLADKPDYVVDAIDTVKSKVGLVKECQKRAIPIISSMGAGNRLDASSFRISDISKTTGCPLAKAVRKLLRQEGITNGFKVVYSPEPAMKPYEDNSVYPPSKRPTPGSISYVPSVAGLLMAGEVVRDILEKG